MARKLRELTAFMAVLLLSLVFTACSEKASVKYVPYKDRAQQQSGEPLTKQGPSVIGEGVTAQPVPSSATASSTLKPYTVMGKTYYPSTVATGEEYSGIASWYGPDFHGKKTASGEPYDMYADTAAHNHHVQRRRLVHAGVGGNLQTITGPHLATVSA